MICNTTYDLRLRAIRSNGKFCVAELQTAPAAHVQIANCANAYEYAYESAGNAIQIQMRYGTTNFIESGHAKSIT
jgi:hypothetical protein